MRRTSWILAVVLLALGACEDTPTVPRRDLDIVKRARHSKATRDPASGQCATKRTFYRDRDGDGFGDLKKPVQACVAPPGFVANREDCFDGNRRARPTQREYFAEHRGDGSYDYDCDGRQVRRFTTRAFCREKEAGGCAVASGWVGRRIPKCGAPAEFAWKVCRELVVVKPPPDAADGGVPQHSAGALVPGAKQQKTYRCGGRKLPWKKRQLCR